MEEKKIFDESIVDEKVDETREEINEDILKPEGSGDSPKEADTDSESKEKEEESKGDRKSDKKKKKSGKALEKALEKSESRVAELTDLYQRLMAEFENARKRNAKEQSRMYDVGAKEVLSKLLPVIDNFERGIDALSEEEKEGAFAQGVIKIYQQLMTTMEELGVKAMDAKGKEFNPDLHNAVMHEESDEFGENEISAVLQCGYRRGDKILRFAMVKVAN